MTLKSNLSWHMRRGFGGVFCLFLLWMTATLTVAQMPTATLLGVVKDASGALVPGAALTARNVDTGQSRTSVTEANGSYRISALPVGNYEIRVEHPGFQSTVHSGLTLTVSQEAVVNFTLQVGAVEQTVAVTAEAPIVNTTSGSLGGLVDQQRMADLPLNGRNYTELTLLQPGVMEHKNLSHSGSMAGTWFSSNGAPLRSNNYLLDGAMMQAFNGGSPASVGNTTLGVEGIREYRIVTNSFAAEYGMTMGSQMLIVSKAGANAFHGSMFEYLRNSVLDARNFFDYKTANSGPDFRLPPYKRNQFGGSLGGPVRKDKVFFFGVYEGLRERLGITTVTNTIPAGCHGAASGTVTNIQCPQLGAALPSVTIAPVIAPLLALYPNPNLPNNRFTFPFSQPTNESYGQARVDQTVSSRDTWFVRYTIDDTGVVNALAYPQFSNVGTSRSQFATLSEDHIFSPTLLNTFRFSYSRTGNSRNSDSGLSGPQYSLVPGRELGGISIGGTTGLGPAGTTPNTKTQNIYSYGDDLFKTVGRHTLKFGTLINRVQQLFINGTNSRGSVGFASIGTFLQGLPNSTQGATPGSIFDRRYHYSTLGFYGQDDLRWSSRLTLNLGLRYEFNTQFEEAHGHGAALRDIQHDANTTLGSPFANPSLRNFSPRFGFAWDVAGNGLTAVRGGFGLLYDIGDVGSPLSAGVGATPPFSSLSTLSNPGPLTLPLVFPASAAGKALRTLDYLLQQPHMLQYNLTVERQLPYSMALTLAYGGSRGINIMKTVDGNPTVPQVLADGRQFWTGNELRTNRNWTSIELYTASGNSWYNSMQFLLTKRLSRGLQFQSTYTWSKLLDERQGQVTGNENLASGDFPPDPTHRSIERGLASFDATQNWRFNAIYRLPQFASAGGVADKLMNGWWLSGILSMQSGYPFTPVLNSNRSRSKVNGGGGGIDRPDLLPGRHGSNIILGGPTQYFDPTAFKVPEAGFLGTAGRNILRGPGYAGLDFSMAKDTSLRFLGDAGKLEFRAEFFNILNRVNFSSPNRTVFAGLLDNERPLATVGTITSTVGSSRQIQFALKILF